MSRDELRLAAALLEMAYERFSNHGCNDFDMSRFLRDPDARDALVREEFGDKEFFEYLNDASVPDYRLGDDSLMRIMSDKLLEAANAA